MKREDYKETLRKFRLRMSAFALTVVIVCGVCLAAADPAGALYILTGEDYEAVVLDEEADAGRVRDISSQLIYADTRSSGFELTLKAGQTVTVLFDGAIVTAQSQGETISALLDRLSVEPGPLDMVLVDISGAAIRLTVASDVTYYDKSVESVAYETVRTPTPDLPLGTEQVVQPGVNGTRTAVYEVVYSGGELISRQFVEEYDSTAVDELVLVGTAVSAVSADDRIAGVAKNGDGSGVLTFRSGGTMKFTAAKSMTATAYTAGHGGADFCTATGTAVRVGTVAVDKRVIPLGTRMYILTNDGSYVYGVAVAADTGVRGSVVDLYYDTYAQCIRFGRRACTVYLLG